MTLTAGARLGPYEIVAPLGAGGMGEVFKGRDTRLGRTVAIKILAPALASDPDFRARFDREARTISSLSHPHICTLFDVGQDQGVDYLVLEYLDGQTLAELCGKGPLPAARAIALGLEVCEALAAAHRAGILHRDLKPGNIMITAAGVKLLDFGLAIAAADRGGAASSPAAATAEAPLTARGMIIGTSQYMAPEQYQGRPADARTDIWAFGCVLYEMIAGRRPFDGETPASIVGAIVSSEPSALPAPGVPAAVERVIRGCLDKDPEARWQDIRDVRRALAAAHGDPGVAAPAPASRRRMAWLATALAALLVIASGAVAMNRKRGAPASPVRFDLPLAAPMEIPRFADTRPYFAVSPDGSQIVISASGGSPANSLWVKAIDAPAARIIPGTAGALSPFWSPDGRSIGFFAGRQLKRVSIDGGSPAAVCRVTGSGWNGTWAPDGTILFAEWGAVRLMRVPADGGEPALAKSGGASPLGWPQMLPDGRHYLFNDIDMTTSVVRGLVGSLDSSEVTPIPGVGSRMEYAAGRLVFWRDGSLIAQPFDVGRAQLTGSPATLAEHVVGFATTGFAAFAVAPGTLVFQSSVAGNRLAWMDRQGRPLGLAGPSADYVTIQLSPDESSVAYCARDQDLGTNDLYILDLPRNAERRLTTDRRTESAPIWTPHGDSLVYAAERAGPPSLFLRPANGPADERSIVPPSPGGPQRPTAVTPDGNFVLYSLSAPLTGADILIAPVDGSGPGAPLIQTRAQESQAHVSADGAWLAYVSDESGRSEVYVQRLRDPSTRRQVSQSGGTAPRWRKDAREMFYLDPAGRDRMLAVDLNLAGPAPVVGVPHLLFAASRRLLDYNVTGDGQRFLLSPDSPREASALSVILHWPDLLR